MVTLFIRFILAAVDTYRAAFQYIRDYSFGLLVIADAEGIEANHVPFHLSSDGDGSLGTLRCHLAVHVQGRGRVIQDPVWLKDHLCRLTAQHERGRAQPWAVDDAPADFTDRLMKAIVGIEIRIEHLTGKLKASQNQPESNRYGVKTGLESEGTPTAKAMSAFIR
ncbi:FMN-binding negative transcriptional regulator [Marinobacter piscensis]|uniref:FMN-binding negative transcriptional regulator n=1 Tax=Marinobacter piscensis TaxID=1562308 RepID=UPI001FE58883|nr:FMN-binding negative transcriptional regulator [Marinobacter piscensis]